MKNLNYFFENVGNFFANTPPLDEKTLVFLDKVEYFIAEKVR